MKKIIIFASVLALTFSMSMSAFASEATSSEQSTAKKEIVSSKIAAVQENVADKKVAVEQKKADASAFRAAVKEKRDMVKENREKNLVLRQENKELREELAASLREIKDSGTTLDAEVAAKLEECHAEMKASISVLKDTKGDVKGLSEVNKGNLKARDYEAMEAAFADIYDVQAARNAELVRINEMLKEMIALL